MRILRVVSILCLLAIPSRPGAPLNGTATCPASGNKTLLASTVAASSAKAVQLTVFAPNGGTGGPAANTGTLYVGGSTVSATSMNSIPLVAGASYNFATQGNASAYDLRQIYFACSASGDSISWTGAQ